MSIPSIELVEVVFLTLMAELLTFSLGVLIGMPEAATIISNIVIWGGL